MDDRLDEPWVRPVPEATESDLEDIRRGATRRERRILRICQDNAECHGMAADAVVRSMREHCLTADEVVAICAPLGLRGEEIEWRWRQLEAS